MFSRPTRKSETWFSTATVDDYFLNHSDFTGSARTDFQPEGQDWPAASGRIFSSRRPCQHRETCGPVFDPTAAFSRQRPRKTILSESPTTG